MSEQAHAPAHTAAQPASPTTSVPGLILQRCACGGTPGVDGECEACRAKRLQRKAADPVRATPPAPLTHHTLHAASPTGSGLILSQPDDSWEREADAAAEAVVAGAPATPAVTVASGMSVVQRDQPTKQTPAPPSDIAKLEQAAPQVGEAFLKTDFGKKLLDQAKELGEALISSLAGKILTGSAVVGAVSALAATHHELPFQLPAIPLDPITPGLSVKLTYTGPVDKPTGASVTFSYSPPVGGEQKKTPTASEQYRAETAKIAADQARFRAGMTYTPGSAEDLAAKAEKAAFQHYLNARLSSLLPGAMFSGTAVHDPKDDLLLMRAADQGTEPEGVPAIVHEVLATSGQPLDTATQAGMGARFGHDFSQVRVHTDARAAESAAAVNALAYTVGRDVVFGAGQYAPDTNAGQRLLAHELTHVVQQHGSGRAAADVGTVSQIEEASEGEAHSVAAAVVGGMPLPAVQSAPGSAVQRAPDDQTSINPAERLDQLYRAALALARQTGNWQDAAEKLNGFNRYDIDQRLRELSSSEVGYLHQGALENPRVGPQSQVALMTAPDASPTTTPSPSSPASNSSKAPGPPPSHTASTEPTTGTPAEKSPLVATSGKGEFEYKLPLPIEAKGAYAKIKSSVGTEVAIERSHMQSKAPEGGRKEDEPPVKVSAGPAISVDDDELSVGAKAEAETRIKQEIIPNTEVSLKGLVGLSTKGGKLGGALSFKGKQLSLDFHFDFISVDWKDLMKKDLAEKDWREAIKFMQLTITSSFEQWFELSPFEYPAGSGEQMKVEFKPFFEVEIEPDWTAIGEAIIEEMGKDAAIELSIEGGIAAAGVLSVLAVYWNAITEGDEIAQSTEDAMNEVKNYARSYANVMRGGDPLEGPAAQEGAKAARKVLDNPNKSVPTEVLIQKARDTDVYSEIANKVKPIIRDRAIKAYWDNHWFEKKIYGEGGANYRLFVRVLDAKLEHIP